MTGHSLWTQAPARPYRCPVCGGKGLVPTGFYNVGVAPSAILGPL